MNRRRQLAACLDSNVFISGIAFRGTPYRLVERVDPLLEDILAVASAFVPSGKHRYIEHEADNLILEISLMGGADVLVTGDRRHLLPLNPFMGLIIEPPSQYLQRLDNIQ